MKCLLAESEVVELIFEDDARMEQSVLDEIIALGLLFIRERYLCQIILSLMWVESTSVCWLPAGDGVFAL